MIRSKGIINHLDSRLLLCFLWIQRHAIITLAQVRIDLIADSCLLAWVDPLESIIFKVGLLDFSIRPSLRLIVERHQVFHFTLFGRLFSCFLFLRAFDGKWLRLNFLNDWLFRFCDFFNTCLFCWLVGKVLFISLVLYLLRIVFFKSTKVIEIDIGDLVVLAFSSLCGYFLKFLSGSTS